MIGSMILIDRFTPLFDFFEELTKEYDDIDDDLYLRAVFGKIYRICDWSPMNICTMSNTKIGDQCGGISRSTVERRIEQLLEMKLIKITGSTAGRTNSLAICDEFVITIDRKKTSVTETQVTESGVTETQVGASQRRTKNTNNKNTKDYKKRLAAAISNGLKLSDMIIQDLKNELRMTPNFKTKANQNHMTFFKEQYEDGKTIKEFAMWWFGETWQGEKGQSPTMNQIREQWLQAFESDETFTEQPKERF